MTTFRKWLLFVGVFAISLIICYIYIVFYYYHYDTPDISWVNGCLVMKEKIDESIPGNKIVFWGGSATHFGVRARQVQERLGVPCVNMAIHAGLQIDYMCNRLKKSLKNGDIIILCLENNYFLYDGTFQEITLDFIFRYDPAYLKSLPLIDHLKYVVHISPLKMLKSLVQSVIKYSNLNPPRAVQSEVFDASSLNENGDETRNIGNDKMYPINKNEKPFHIPSGEFVSSKGLQIISDFNKWCKNNNISLYVTYASTLFFEDYNTPPYIDYFRNLQQYFIKEKIPTLGMPRDFFYQRKYFYDGVNHLNQEGMTLRTTQLINLMEEVI